MTCSTCGCGDEDDGRLPRVADEAAALGGLDGCAGVRGASADVSDVGVGGKLHRPVAQPDGVRGRRSDAPAVPDVAAEVVVVTAGGHERGRSEVRLQLEAEHVAVEAQAV